MCLCPTRHKMSFWRRSPSESLGLVWKELNIITQQKHAFTNQKKCTTTQNKQKTKARFSHLLRHPAWKQRGPILILVLHKIVAYLPTYLQPRDSHGADS